LREVFFRLFAHAVSCKSQIGGVPREVSRLVEISVAQKTSLKTVAELAFTNLQSSMFYYVLWFQEGKQVVGFVAAITTGVAVCIDLVIKSQRDWLHWIGVVVAVVDLVLVPLLRFVSIYFMQEAL